MKKYIFIFAILITTISIKGYSQSAVYFCEETGSYGFAYSYPADIVNSKAYDACITFGGIKPILIVSTTNKGFGAIALGTNSKGTRVIGASAGFNTLNEAKNAALNACRKNDGQDVYISDTWHDE